jgi:hypothetical protein
LDCCRQGSAAEIFGSGRRNPYRIRQDTDQIVGFGIGVVERRIEFPDLERGLKPGGESWREKP